MLTLPQKVDKYLYLAKIIFIFYTIFQLNYIVNAGVIIRSLIEKIKQLKMTWKASVY